MEDTDSIEQNKSEDYPEQFYRCPYFKDHKSHDMFISRILVAIANEIHSLRIALTKKN